MISIIIPTYKVTKKEVINSIQNLTKEKEVCEIILSEGEKGGISHFFSDICSAFENKTIKLVENPNPKTTLSRGESMNLGAALAKGNILLFLHIDNRLPKLALSKIQTVMKNKNFVAGAFLKTYNKRFAFSITKIILNLRTLLLKETVGTNALFIRNKIFKTKPYPNHFMEDFVFSKELIKTFSRKNIVIIKDYVTVSSRKYLKTGILKNIFINAIILLLFHLKIRDYDKLKELYTLQNNKASYYSIIKLVYNIIKTYF